MQVTYIVRVKSNNNSTRQRQIERERRLVKTLTTWPINPIVVSLQPICFIKWDRMDRIVVHSHPVIAHAPM